MAKSTFSKFLNTESWAPKGVPLVDTSQPVAWTRLAFAIVLGALTQLTLGILAVINSWVEGSVNVIEGVITFFTGTVTLSGEGDFGVTVQPGLQDVMLQPIIGFLRGGLGINLQQYGAFAWLVSMVVVLATLYIASVSTRYAITITTGGDLD